MLVDDLKKQLTEAMKARRTVEKEVLRVALGEIQTIEARGEAVDDALVTRVLRKLVKSNQETLAATEQAERRQELEEEIRVIEGLLPKRLGVEEIVAALAEVADAIRAANSDGQATGVAMKHLKGSGAAVDGKLVSDAIKKMREG
jgi:uncharacterized protein YqeY